MNLSSNSKRTPPPPRRGTLNHRFTIIGPLFAVFASALLLAACPDPGGTGTSTGGGGGTDGGTNTGGGGGTRPTTYTTTVNGTVQDRSTNIGLPGVAVSASTKPEPTTTTTGPNGAFTLEVTHSGTLPLTLTAQKACYEPPTPQNITLSKDTRYNADVIELTIGPEPQDDNRFALDPNPDSTAANPTYTLTIADCVRIITPGEFAADPATTSTTANTRLTALGASPTSKVTAIRLPDSLVRIEVQAFAGHEKVSGDLTIPPTVDYIGSGAFYRLSSASGSDQVNLNFAPNSKLKFIGSSAFSYARLRAFPRLPRSLETVEDDAFYLADHPRVSNFVILENVRELGSRAFGSTGVLFAGTLTIESPHLRRTPPLNSSGGSHPPRTGRLGNSIFSSAGGGISSRFTSIILHKTVFDSYSQTDLDTIFGTGGSYVDFADGTAVLTK